MVKWTPQSESDLTKIQEHIAKHFNVELAINIISNLIDFTEKSLKKNPLIGSIVESNPLFSKLVYEGNEIYYCENPVDKNLYIVYVHPRRMKMRSRRLARKNIA